MVDKEEQPLNPKSEIAVKVKTASRWTQFTFFSLNIFSIFKNLILWERLRQ
jgi:hypothetical protein